MIVKARFALQERWCLLVGRGFKTRDDKALFWSSVTTATSVCTTLTQKSSYTQITELPSLTSVYGAASSGNMEAVTFVDNTKILYRY